MSDQIQLAYDNRILGEYEEVLARPELRLDQVKVLGAIDHIELSGRLIEPESLPKEGYTDPDDIMFAEVFLRPRQTRWSQAICGTTNRCLRKMLPCYRQLNFWKSIFLRKDIPYSTTVTVTTLLFTVSPLVVTPSAQN